MTDTAPTAGDASDPNMDWALTIDAETNELNQNPRKEARAWNKLSIYRVPMHMCDVSVTAYKPQVVSLGPYHHGRKPLSLMEVAKRRALVHLLGETKKSVNDYLNPLRDLTLRETIMESYEQLDDKWQRGSGEESFLQQMVLDGCFMIEILRQNFARYASSDPVFSELRQPTVIEYIRRDMLLLENQLPLLLLEKLAAIVAEATGSESDINTLLLKFCFPGKEVTYKGGGMHMLDVARQHMLHIPTENAQEARDPRQPGKCETNLLASWIAFKGFINDSWFVYELQRAIVNVKSNEIIQQSATELCQAWFRLKEITRNSWSSSAPKDKSKRTLKNSRTVEELYQVGINFRRSKTHSLKDITFMEDTLRLPTLTIQHNSESMFLNFIAFEQLHLDKGRFTSSYFLFMGGLIASTKDVKLLRDCDIIESSVASDIDIVRMIKKLGKGMSFGNNDPLDEVQQELNNFYMKSEKRCKRKAKSWWSNMCDTYFASPWTIIKLTAAILLLCLTVLSTVYTILQLYKGNGGS